MPKFSYLRLPSDSHNADVYIDGELLKLARTETYLGMTRSAERLRTESKARRIASARREVGAQINSTWWSAALNPGQFIPAFKAVVRAKYTYGLPFLHMTREKAKSDVRCCEIPREALPKTKALLHTTDQYRLRAIWQCQDLAWMVAREANGWVRRWKFATEK